MPSVWRNHGLWKILGPPGTIFWLEMHLLCGEIIDQVIVENRFSQKVKWTGNHVSCIVWLNSSHSTQERGKRRWNWIRWLRIGWPNGIEADPRMNLTYSVRTRITLIFLRSLTLSFLGASRTPGRFSIERWWISVKNQFNLITAISVPLSIASLPKPITLCIWNSFTVVSDPRLPWFCLYIQFLVT